MARQQARRHPNPDFRHRVPVPVPAVEEVEQQLWTLLSPSLLAPRVLERRDPHPPQRMIRLRARLLTLPVMVAIIVSLVWRRLGAVAEVQRVLAREGLLWVQPLKVSEQAIAKRLDTLPAGVRGELFAEVCARLQAQPLPTWPGLEEWAQVRAHFPRLALLDGSTLEALRNKTRAWQRIDGVALAGRMMVMVEACSQRPLWHLYTEDAAANDKRFAPQILAAVPVGSLGVFDLGFFSFLWFDDFTDQQKFFVTRMRHKTAYRTTQLLSQGPRYRDELITLGLYRSNPCRHPLRLVSVLWAGQWYRYLTNVLDPQGLAARQVCELYRRRWRIGVSREGSITQSVQVRPRPRDSSLVAREAPGRESKLVKPSDTPLRKEWAQRSRLQRTVNADVASSHATPVAETVDNVRRQQGPRERSLSRRFSPAGSQRRHGAKGDRATGEVLGARRRKLVGEA